MKKTAELMQRLEALLGAMCLRIGFDKDSFSPVKSGTVYQLVNWDEKEVLVKPWFSKNYTETRIVGLWFRDSTHFGTEFLGFSNKDLEWRLERLENDRELWISVREQVKKFGFHVTKIVPDEE